MIFKLVLISGILIQLGVKGDNALIASFNKYNIKGTLKFEQNGDDIKVTSKFDSKFQGCKNITKIEIYKQLPSSLQKQCVLKNEVYSCSANLNSTGVTIMKIGKKINGTNSIFAQTVALKDKNNNMLDCTVITSKEVNSTYAVSFISNKNMSGKIEFVQNQFGDIAIFGKLMFIKNGTDNLKYHISNEKVFSKDGSCNPNLEKIFDPTNQTNGIKCQKSVCPLGDLSGQLSGLTLVTDPRKEEIFAIFPYSNFDLLPAIISKAFVIESNGKIIGCGNIEMKGPLEVQSTFEESKHERISGYVKFTQVSPYHQTKLQVSLNGLDKRVKGYHVHQFPISDLDSPCSQGSVGGHLNPEKVDIKKSPKPKSGTMDKYEYGDLSGKYGFLTNLTGYSIVEYDECLPLYGPSTVVGRSVVIHANDAGGSRFVCSNIVPLNARKMSATANFTADTTSDYQGIVKMQQWKLSNGIFTETAFQVQLENKDPNKKSNDHSWHVHETKVKHNGETGYCVSAGLHYNPYKINIKIPEYKQDCSPENRFSCEIGDTSGKVDTYDINGKKRFYADELSPLFGNLTGMGRSITFHAANKKGPRIACADIMPDSGKDILYHELHLKGKSYMNENKDLAIMLCEYLSIPPGDSWKMNSVQTEASTKNYDCFKVTFYVLGESSENEAYKKKLEKFVVGNEKLGGIIDKCKGPTGKAYQLDPSKFILLISLILMWFAH